MSDIAIRVENLGKRYRIGGQQAHYKTLRESLVGAAGTPLRWVKGERTPAYNDFWALEDVSFDVKQGEVVGIIGRNGAGKSTLLKVLSRITKPTRGRVELNGRVGSLLEVGTGFHPELTGRENIYLNGAILGMSRTEISQKFDEIVAFAETEKFLDTQVKFYSSGMYVRLAFAVAAHLEPEILVVDEVLAVGDAEFQKKSLGKMSDVAQAGRTVLFVSHNMGAVNQLCKRGLVLRSGKLVLDTSAQEAVSYYLNDTRNLYNQVKFDIDSSKDVQILSMWLSNKDGKIIDTCAHTEDFCVNIEYEIRKWKTGSYVCLDTFNENDIRILWESDVKTVDEMNLVRSPGVYLARITIPGMILSPGRYYFTGAILAPGRGVAAFEAQEKAISIDIVDAGTLLSNFGIKYHAATTVPLQWDTQKQR